MSKYVLYIPFAITIVMTLYCIAYWIVEFIQSHKPESLPTFTDDFNCVCKCSSQINIDVVTNGTTNTLLISKIGDLISLSVCNTGKDDVRIVDNKINVCVSDFKIVADIEDDSLIVKLSIGKNNTFKINYLK